MKQNNKPCVYSDERFKRTSCPDETREVGEADIRERDALPTYDGRELNHSGLDGYDDYLEDQVPAENAYAMAQMQEHGFDELYRPQDALMRGTIFSRLDLPFNGRGVERE